MKRGEVAVENSVANAFRGLESSKLKTRTMAPFGSPSHHQKRGYPRPPHSPYQSRVFIPAPTSYNQQRLSMLSATSPVLPLPVYQGTPPMTHPRLSRSVSANQIPHLHHRGQPPLPPPQPYSGVTRYTTPNDAPISDPVQLQATPSMSVFSAQQKNNVCMRFTRGACYYGASCKFSHGETDSTDVPRSAPAAIYDRDQIQVVDQLEDKQSDCPSSLDDHNFPSLPSEPSGVGKFKSQNGAPITDNQLNLSPSTTLVFRDAVLQQHKRAEVKPVEWPSPVKTSRTCGEEPLKKPDEEDAESGNQSGVGSAGDRRLLGSLQGQQTNVSLLPHRDGGRYVDSKPGRTDNYTRTARLRGTPVEHHPIQPVLPQSGQPGYTVQPVYQTKPDPPTDDYAASSHALSQEASEFVGRVNSSLQAGVHLQQRAISKLQEVATNLWCDAKISIYGSSFTRLALPHSDIDCVLSSPSVISEQPTELLTKLAAEVQGQPWARRVELLGNAKIPVLKIVFCQSAKFASEVMLDLTCAHSPGHSGLRARELIYSHQAKMPALRPLVLILKSHIQRRGLNSAYTGGLSSYGLVLLVIRFLQACGDEHHLGEARDGMQGEDIVEGSGLSTNYAHLRSDDFSNAPSVYEFSRDGKLSWRTRLGSLLLLFLETYVTFDYRRFGITVEGNGQYFPLPSDKISLEPATVVSPYIVDPINPTRSIGNCFRMHDIIQAWYEFYVQLTNGVTLDNAIEGRVGGNAISRRNAGSSA